jgi:hypothetical protein
MIKKVCFSPDNQSLETHEYSAVSANPEVVRRFSKLAKSIKNIAPKSDDFLYFSIIFLKAAESALLDENGNLKKVGKEDAWGFYDGDWKWHGNVSPHRNNNKDIFPESELKKATASWIGLPLCRDHESSSVDGIRGIILDTHYDEKYKQVVGLCALDKVNYPDLARKVETRMVRYGSMGTAVETSICSDCGKRATNQNEYCKCITSHAAYGEINVGLKPIEYSLVVQPAEPGAVLLKCIASLKEYRKDFTNYGVDNVSDMLGRLSLQQAQHLDGIMKTACGGDSCSIEDRDGIVRGFLANNGLLKSSSIEESEIARNFGEALEPMSDAASLLNDPQVGEDVKRVVKMLMGKLEESFRPDLSSEKTERVTSYESSDESGPGDVQELSSATSRMGLIGGGDTGDIPDFAGDDDILNFPSGGGEPSVSVTSSEQNQKVKTANVGSSGDFVNDFSINSIMEDIMNESRLRKRAELRRRIAYMQGGAEGAEPNTYKSEPYTFSDHKQMHQDKSMGGDTGMVPGDAEIKGKLSRAELEERRLKRLAYMQGGAEGAEPNTYKSEPYTFNDDKQMHQDKSMGGDKGMVPGDAEVKAKQSRAAYDGPGLSTRFSVKRGLNGRPDKARSVLEVFAGDKRVIAATGREIFGPELEENWEWLKSQDYGREVCKQIRTSGLSHVSSLLKTAQEMPAEAPMPEMAEMAEMPAEAPMPEVADMGELGEEELGAEEPEEPGVGIDNRLAEIEQLIDEVRDLVSELEDGRTADVDVNVFTGAEEGEGDLASEMTALSSGLLRNLKVAFERLDGSADELSMVAETYDNLGKLSTSQKVEFTKLASDAVKDADRATGEVKALVRVAMEMAADAPEATDEASDFIAAEQPGGAQLDAADDGEVDAAADADMEDLVSEAMQLRRNRREAILKQAESRLKKDAQEESPFAATDGADDEIAEAALAADEAADVMVDEASDFTDMGARAAIATVRTIAETAGYPWKPEYEQKLLSEFDPARGGGARKGAVLLAKLVAMGAGDLIDWLSFGLTEPITPHPDLADDGTMGGLGLAAASLKNDLNDKMQEKRADEAREAFRIKLRRAYDVGLDMQSKGLLPASKASLDRQVDEIMSFDNNAFEAFKRSIANARPIGTMKIASDLGGLNIGVETEDNTAAPRRMMSADALSSLWED